jgi:hypothetical protein
MTTPTVPRLWPGSTIACIATGPSLVREDCERVRESGARIFAINDAYQLAPFADVLYSSDRHWWPHHKGVPSFTGMKYGIGSAIGKANPFFHHPEITVLRNDGYTGLSTDPSGLRNGKNSGYAAINLAVLFGAARIILLGYNLSYLNGLSHFFGNHPPNMQNTAALYPSFRRAFATLVEPLAELGVEVINCTPHTSLDAFPIRDLNDVFPTPLAVAS